MSDNSFKIDEIRHLTPREAQKLCCEHEAVILDVREEYMNRFKMFDVETVVFCPYSILDDKKDELSQEQIYIVADATGIKSKKAVKLLQENGFKNIYNLAGGIVEWERDKLPLVLDMGERLTGSCMCQLKPRDRKKTDNEKTK